MSLRSQYGVFPEGTFTRSRIAKFTGLGDEVLSHWTKEGLLIPQNDQTSGAGRHKEFDLLEVEKAAALGKMRELGCGMEALKWFSSVFDRGRFLSTLSEFYPIDQLYSVAFAMRSYRQFLAGERVTYREPEFGDDVPARNIDDCLEIALSGNGYDKEESEARRLVLRSIVQEYHSELDIHAANIMAHFTPESVLDSRVDSVLMIWQTPKGWDLYEDSACNLSGFMATNPLAGIVLFPTRLMRELWGIKEWHIEIATREREADRIRRRLERKISEKADTSSKSKIEKIEEDEA